jgi:MerR family transcriptional regulator, light-induced transcriptional regulator
MIHAHQTISMAAKRSELTPHVIRVWEKRYGALRPERTATNRRIYSEAPIERLSLLKDLREKGHSIGQVARLPVNRLRKRCIGSTATIRIRADVAAPLAFGDECIAAVAALDARALEDALKRSSLALRAQGLLQNVIAPLIRAIGDGWRDGTLTAAHEHFACPVTPLFLGAAAQSFAGTEHAPGVVVTTPARQLHELGPLLAGAAACHLGWKVTYLGPSRPAAEIASAAIQNRARAVALSLVYPEDDPHLDSELLTLRRFLPDRVELIGGGRAAPAYRPPSRKPEPASSRS